MLFVFFRAYIIYANNKILEQGKSCICIVQTIKENGAYNSEITGEFKVYIHIQETGTSPQTNITGAEMKLIKCYVC